MRQQAGIRYDIHYQAADARPTPLVVSAHSHGLAATFTLLRLPLALILCALASCARFRTGPQPDDWQVTLAGAQARAGSGEFAAADSMLGAYAMRHPGTHESLETTYWRAVFKADPSNNSATTTQALAALDGYLRDPRPRDHILEAQTLRRAVAQIDALNRAAEAASAREKDATNQAANAKAAAADAKENANKADANANAAAADKDAEIRRLKDELAKATAELDRIRKRLGTPPPRP